MALNKLCQEEQEIVLSCLHAIGNGSFIKDWEFSTRLGVDRSIFTKIMKMWPNIDDSVANSDEALVINNAMNEVCHGIKFSDTEWRAWFNVNRAEIQKVFKTWKHYRTND